MKTRHLTVLFVLGLVSCGGDDDASTNAKTVNQLDGTYKPADASHSDIASITFTNNADYLLMPTGCSAGGCAEIGKYRIDQDTSTLWLGARSMPLEVLSTSPSNASLVKQSLRIMGDLVDPGTQLSQPGQQLNNGSGNQLNQSTGNKLADQISQLIQTITQMIMQGQQMNQQGQGGQQGGQQKPNPLDCTQGVPTAQSTEAEKLAYFARCPGGP